MSNFKKQGVTGKPSNGLETPLKEAGLCTAIHSALRSLQQLFYSMIQHLGPKSPSRRVTTPSPPSAQPLLRRSTPRGPPALGPNADIPVPTCPSWAGLLPRQVLAVSPPPQTLPHLLHWPGLALTILVHHHFPRASPLSHSVLKTSWRFFQNKVQTLWQGLGGHLWPGPSRLISTHR